MRSLLFLSTIPYHKHTLQSPKPCHVGIHLKALAEHYQMSTRVPASFQSFFHFLFIGLSKLATSSTMVNIWYNVWQQCIISSEHLMEWNVILYPLQLLMQSSIGIMEKSPVRYITLAVISDSEANSQDMESPKRTRDGTYNTETEWVRRQGSKLAGGWSPQLSCGSHLFLQGTQKCSGFYTQHLNPSNAEATFVQMKRAQRLFYKNQPKPVMLVLIG